MTQLQCVQLHCIAGQSRCRLSVAQEAGHTSAQRGCVRRGRGCRGCLSTQPANTTGRGQSSPRSRSEILDVTVHLLILSNLRFRLRASGLGLAVSHQLRLNLSCFSVTRFNDNKELLHITYSNWPSRLPSGRAKIAIPSDLACIRHGSDRKYTSNLPLLVVSRVPSDRLFVIVITVLGPLAELP